MQIVKSALCDGGDGQVTIIRACSCPTSAPADDAAAVDPARPHLAATHALMAMQYADNPSSLICQIQMK